MRAFVTAEWSDVVIASYAVPDAALEMYRIPGVVWDRWEDSAYVSVVAFHFGKIRMYGLNPVPDQIGRFPQWNLRLYIRAGEERGVQFVREYVRHPFVGAGVRLLYREPYYLASLTGRASRDSGVLRVRYDLVRKGRRSVLAATGTGDAATPAPGSASTFFTPEGWGCSRHDWRIARGFRVVKPVWQSYAVAHWTADIDFAGIYGPNWAFLSGRAPDSVVLSEGSAITASPLLPLPCP
jgi:uncharacterized protein YqjF (DUF2071 family)